jgi:hypothetical protein
MFNPSGVVPSFIIYPRFYRGLLKLNPFGVEKSGILTKS